MKKYRYLIVLALVVIIGVAGFSMMNKKDTLEVRVMSSYKGDITKYVEVSGIVNSNQVQVIPLEAGRDVVKIHVEENDYVKENQLLAELDTTDLVLSLKKAMVNIEDLNAKVYNLSNDKSEGVLLSNALERSKEEYSVVSADLNKANEDLEKAQILYKEGAISKEEFDQYEFQVDKLTSNLKKAELNLIDARESYGDSEEGKKQDISSYERQIRLLELDIESINNKIMDSKLYSNIEGYLTEFPLEESNKILSGEKVTIHGNSSYEINAKVNQQDSTLIKEGLKSIVNIDGLSKDYEGIVTFVSKIAESDNSGNESKVEIRVKITNPDEAIIFGYEGYANIVIDEKKDANVLKNECIRKEDNKEFVYVVEGNIAKKVYVKTGITDGYLVDILDGIKANDLVILNPPLDITNGSSVKAIK